MCEALRLEWRPQFSITVELNWEIDIKTFKQRTQGELENCSTQTQTIVELSQRK